MMIFHPSISTFTNLDSILFVYMFRKFFKRFFDFFKKLF